MTAAPFCCLRLASAILLPLSQRKTGLTLGSTTGRHLFTRRHYTAVVTLPSDGGDVGDYRKPPTPSVVSHTNVTRTNTNQRQLNLADHSLHDGHFKYRLRNAVGFEEDGTAPSSPSARPCRPLTGVVTGQYRDTDHVEMLGLLGYDFLWADAEHSSATPDDVAHLILAAERRGLPTLVRIGYGYQDIVGHVQKYLVAGAQGIILPQCEAREDVERLVDAVKFPPEGRRGLAGERWNAWGLARQQPQEGPVQDCDSSSPLYERLSLAQCVEEANRNSIVGVVVESLRGIDALEDILTVPELDFVFVAPTDLSADMGLHGQIRHPLVLAKIEEAGRIIYEANLKRHRTGIKEGTIAAGTFDSRRLHLLATKELSGLVWRCSMYVRGWGQGFDGQDSRL